MDRISHRNAATIYCLEARGFELHEAIEALCMFQTTHGTQGPFCISDVAQEYIARSVGAGVVAWDLKNQKGIS